MSSWARRAWRSDNRLWSWAGAFGRMPAIFCSRLATVVRSWAASVSRVVRFCCACGAERARLRLGERRSRGLDLALDRRQALLELRRVLLDEGLDLGDRRGINAQASGKVGDEAPVFEGDDAALGRDELALVLDQVDEALLRPIDRGGDEILNSRRGERRLRHVRGELSRRRRDRSGERLGGGRQPLLDLGLDVDVGVELVDREDAELLLDVLVLEDLVGAVGELAACRGPGSEPSSRSSRRAAPSRRARRGPRRGRGGDASALAPRDPPSARSRRAWARVPRQDRSARRSLGSNLHQRRSLS